MRKAKGLALGANYMIKGMDVGSKVRHDETRGVYMISEVTAGDAPSVVLKLFLKVVSLAQLWVTLEVAKADERTAVPVVVGAVAKSAAKPKGKTKTGENTAAQAQANAGENRLCPDKLIVPLPTFSAERRLVLQPGKVKEFAFAPAWPDNRMVTRTGSS